jgi:hypothetical protein
MTLFHLMNHVNFVRYATDLTFIWSLAFDVLAEGSELRRGGISVSEAGSCSGKSPQGAESYQILSREGEYDVQQSQ